MRKVEEIFDQLIELSDSELDVIRQKIIQIRRSRNGNRNYTGNPIKPKASHKERMIEFNPFLEGRI
jgi:hypothetical protein